MQCEDSVVFQPIETKRASEVIVDQILDRIKRGEISDFRMVIRNEQPGLSESPAAAPARSCSSRMAGIWKTI